MIILWLHKNALYIYTYLPLRKGDDGDGAVEVVVTSSCVSFRRVRGESGVRGEVSGVTVRSSSSSSIGR